MLIDTHCHLFYTELKNDLSAVLNRAKTMGVTRLITIGTNIEDSRECFALSETYDNIYGTAGVHPHDANDVSEDFCEQLADLMTGKHMVALGEMGLDYYRNLSSPETQRTIFRQQMQLAQALKKPVVFHNREADKDMIQILSEFPEVKGVAHCFSSDVDTAKAFLDMGYYISFSGNLTFRNSHLPEVVKNIPLDRVMVETDSPYLSPVPFRGKPNEPGRTRFVAEKLAEIHDLPFEEIAKHTTENVVELFRLF